MKIEQVKAQMIDWYGNSRFTAKEARFATKKQIEGLVAEGFLTASMCVCVKPYGKNKYERVEMYKVNG